MAFKIWSGIISIKIIISSPLSYYKYLKGMYVSDFLSRKEILPMSVYTRLPISVPLERQISFGEKKSILLGKK